MTKTINADVSAFKDDFFKGLSLRECLYGGGVLAVGAGGILFLHFYWLIIRMCETENRFNTL